MNQSHLGGELQAVGTTVPELHLVSKGSKQDLAQKDLGSVSYLGVELLRRNDPNHSDPRKYANDVITNYERNLRQQLAVALDLNQPLLYEAGSGIGKTTSIKAMCAELGWNAYYVNCAKYDPEMVIGMVRDDESTKSGFGWRDGIALSAIRNGGVLILDELNNMKGHTKARLHEILDAVLNGEECITLPENGGEQVRVHPNFRLMAFQNSLGEHPTQEEHGAAFLTRFVYMLGDEKLPESVEKSRALGSVGQPFEETIELQPNLHATKELSWHELGQIEGIGEILDSYVEFHNTIEGLVGGGQLGADQTQPLHMTYSRDLRRLLSFVAHYYNGNILETFHRGLEYYYVNRFSAESDREKVNELIQTISLASKEDPKREVLTTTEGIASSAAKVTNGFHLRADTTQLEMYQYLRSARVTMADALPALCGDNSPEAWAIRRDAALERVPMGAILQSIAGVEGEEADRLRLEALERGASVGAVLHTMGGVEVSDPSLSRTVLFNQINKAGVSNRAFFAALNGAAISLIGRRDEEASEIRAQMASPAQIASRTLRTVFWPGEREFWNGFRTDGENTDGYAPPPAWVGSILFPFRLLCTGPAVQRAFTKALLTSISGMEDDFAWELRDRKAKSSEIGPVLSSLAGLSSSRSWELRNTLVSKTDQYKAGSVLISLMGVDSKLAYDLWNTHKENGRELRKEPMSLAVACSESAFFLNERRSLVNSDVGTLVKLISNPLALAVKRAITNPAK